MSSRLKAGDKAPPFDMADIADVRRSLSQLEGHKSMVSFYRYAACPLCNLRVHRLIQAYPDLQKQGLHMVGFFQSPKASILKNVGKQDSPFPIVPDPERKLYKDYGVEPSWGGYAKGMLRVGEIMESAGKGFKPGTPDGPQHMIPADFLLNPDLTIHTAYYGADIGDHVPIDTIRQFLQ